MYFAGRAMRFYFPFAALDEAAGAAAAALRLDSAAARAADAALRR